MKITNLQPGLLQPLPGLKGLGNSSGGSGSGSLVETLTGTAASISIPGGAQAFTALKNLLKSAGSIGAANTIQNDFAKLATALGGTAPGGGASASSNTRRPGAYQEQSGLSAAAGAPSHSTVSLVA